MEDQRVNDLVRKGILLLQQSLDEDVGCAAAFRPSRAFLRRNVAETLDGGSGMENGDGDSHKDR